MATLSTPEVENTAVVVSDDLLYKVCAGATSDLRFGDFGFQ